MTGPAAPLRSWVPLLVGILAVSFGLRVVTGTAVLDHSYHFDERYSFRNVSALLVEGSLRPANAYYPSLSYLPQAGVLAASEALHRLTGVERLEVLDDDAPDGYSRTAYLLVRLMAAAFGTLSIWLTFVVGRRMFDARTGLLAAALLSAVPSHVSHSALFKPDILVVLLVVLAFLWSREAVHSPRAGRYLRAGTAVGLAVAAKYTGVAAALPLAAGSAVAGWRVRRLWAWLVAAGAVAVAVFLALNPHLGMLFEYLPRLWRIYESGGEAEGGGRLSVMAEQASFLVRNHRLPVVLFALYGLVGAATRAVGQATARPLRLDAVLLLAVPVGYTLLYAATTTLFKGQNYLLITPFTSLLAAWPMVALWDRLRRWRPWLGDHRLAVAVWGAVAAAILVTPAVEVYRVRVPTTFELAQRSLSGLGTLEQRLVFYERRETPLRVMGGWRRAATLPVERLDGVEREKLRRADGEVFFAARLESREAGFYWERLGSATGRVRRIEEELWRARGPSLVVLEHPWELSAEPLALRLRPARGADRVRARLPPVAPGELVSFGIWVPLDDAVSRPRKLQVAGREMPLYDTGIVARRVHLATGRTEAGWPGGWATLAFDRDLPLRWPPRVTLYRWRPAAGESGSPGAAAASGP